jgi:phospholipid/cholesterol/gamma-HCH transport system substrate-binding protein
MRTAAASLAVLALALAGCGDDGEKPRDDGMLDITAVFAPELDQAVGAGTPVRASGINIGEVTSVERGDQAVVHMRLREPPHQGASLINADATVKVRPRIFEEGEYFLDVDPGTSAERTLKDGDEIPLAQTATPGAGGLP